MLPDMARPLHNPASSLALLPPTPLLHLHENTCMRTTLCDCAARSLVRRKMAMVKLCCISLGIISQPTISPTLSLTVRPTVTRFLPDASSVENASCFKPPALSVMVEDRSRPRQAANNSRANAHLFRIISTAAACLFYNAMN